MARIVKSTRDVMNIDEELKKLETGKKKSSKKKEPKKTTTTKEKNVKKKSASKKKHSKIYSFFKEIKNEMAKVKWPSKKDMIKYSMATISFVVFFALFFYLIDIIIAALKAGV